MTEGRERPSLTGLVSQISYKLTAELRAWKREVGAAIVEQKKGM